LVAQLPYLTRGVLSGEVQGYRGDTPYLRYGDAPALALILLGLVAGAVAAMRAGRSR
jgi:apolipoprotein N-acyltransferase